MATNLVGCLFEPDMILAPHPSNAMFILIAEVPQFGVTETPTLYRSATLVQLLSEFAACLKSTRPHDEGDHLVPLEPNGHLWTREICGRDLVNLLTDRRKPLG